MDYKKYIQEMGGKAKEAAYGLANMPTEKKNELLNKMADSLDEHADEIIAENNGDLDASDLRDALKDRLMLNKERITSIANDVRKVATLPDPVGEVVEENKLENGLILRKTRVPLGVIAIIYESRPNVTVDAASLAIKSGNAIILRGGKEALNSNKALVRAINVEGLPENAIQLVEVAEREAASELMKARGYVDLLIPRGGQGLIQSVVLNSTVPVIETGIGNCHMYVDGEADLEMAKKLLINAKCQRPGVCNAIEKLVVNEKVAGEFLPIVGKELMSREVQIIADKKSAEILKSAGVGFTPATDEDWAKEYLDLIIGIKVVSSVDEAIKHINLYSSMHSDAIVTANEEKAKKFLQLVDSAAVYWNASTRFTDGGMFGLGAELGISTQKLHARGPMALKEMTSTKYQVIGQGQIRE